MSALVKLSGNRTGRLVTWEPAGDGVTMPPTPSYLGLQLVPGASPILTLVGGEKDGEPAESTLRANQKVCLRLGTLRSLRYHALIETNPALAAWATVQAPRILEPNEVTSLDVYLRAERAFDLAATLEAAGGWAVRIYLLD